MGLPVVKFFSHFCSIEQCASKCLNSCSRLQTLLYSGNFNDSLHKHSHIMEMHLLKAILDFQIRNVYCLVFTHALHNSEGSISFIQMSSKSADFFIICMHRSEFEGYSLSPVIQKFVNSCFLDYQPAINGSSISVRRC